MLFFDVLTSASPSTKRLKSGLGPLTAGVEQVKRNLDSAGEGSSSAPAVSKEKFIGDMVNERSHLQFHNLDVARCKLYLNILNVTLQPDNNLGLSKLKKLLVKSLSEEIFARLGNLDRANKILHHHGLPKLKSAPVSTPSPADADNTSPTTPVTDDIDIDILSADLATIISHIRQLNSKRAKLSKDEKKLRGDLITLIISRCGHSGALRKFLVDHGGPRPQGKVEKFNGQLVNFVSGQVPKLEALMELLLQYQEFDQLLARASTSSMIFCLEQNRQKIANRGEDRIRGQLTKFVKDHPTTIGQLRKIVEDQEKLAAGGSSPSSSQESSSDLDNSQVTRALVDYDSLSQETHLKLQAKLKCKQSQVKKRLLKRIVAKCPQTSKLRELLRAEGFSPQKGQSQMMSQTVTIGLKNPNMLQKIIR